VAAITRQAITSSRPRSWRLRSPLLFWAVGLIAIGVGLFVGYLHQASIAPENSDGAAQALQAWDMLHGNLLLHGWSMSDVSFYTTELPEYALVELVRGLTPQVIHISAALTWTLIVLLGALVARGDARGREGLLRAVIAATILVAPSIVPGTRVLMLSPNHTGTSVPILVTLLALDKLPARRWAAALIGILLIWGQVGDQLVIYSAALPLTLICLLRAVWSRREGKQEGQGRTSYDAWLTLAGAVSIVLALAIPQLIHALGGYYQAPLQGLLASPSQWVSHARTVFACLRILFGALPGGTAGFLGFVAWLRVACMIFAGLALLGGIAFFRRIGRTAQVLVLGILGTLAAGVFGTHVTQLSDAHEIAVVFPMGAALAGRLFPDRVLRGRRLLASGPVLGAVLGCFLAALAIAATAPPARPSNLALANWLQAHNLRAGMSGYWQADSVTLDSHERVLIFPAVVSARGISPYRWETKEQWFNAAVTNANFVVEDSSDRTGYSVPLAWLEDRFGHPARVYHFQDYTILTWKENLLTRIS
jgi:hypothetical protein